MSEINHPLFARIYRSVAANAERKGAFAHRRELVGGLSGRVVEVGCGPGLNFKHYPSSVTEVVAVEPEPTLRAEAEVAARGALVPVTVVSGVAESIDAADGSFDAAVVSFVLCSVADQAVALAELRRVIRPGGELRFYEHVLATDSRLRALQKAVAVVWPHVAGGCHLDRDTLSAISDAGFSVENYRRFPFWPSLVFVPVAPHILGTARR